MGVAYFGPIFGIACIICYKNPFNPSLSRPLWSLFKAMQVKQNKNNIKTWYCVAAGPNMVLS